MGVVTSADIDAPLHSVWSLISDFAGLKRWHPLVERCETKGSGEGAVRTVHFADWWLVERLDRLDETDHVVAYSVIDSNRPPMIGVKGTMSLTSEGEQRTRLLWISGLGPENPHAAKINATLEVYYPIRVGHLSLRYEKGVRSE
jgi:hypothetical protein